MRVKRYDLNPTAVGEKNLATAVLYSAVRDYINGRKIVNHFGSSTAAVIAWEKLSKKQKKHGEWFDGFKLNAHKMIQLGHYPSAKEFLYPTRENSALTALWTGLAEIPIGHIRRGLNGG